MFKRVRLWWLKWKTDRAVKKLQEKIHGRQRTFAPITSGRMSSARENFSNPPRSYSDSSDYLAPVSAAMDMGTFDSGSHDSGGGDCGGGDSGGGDGGCSAD